MMRTRDQRRYYGMKINDTIKTILINRGISEGAEMDEFLSPSPKLTYDPFKLKNMKEATDLILKFAGEGKKICVYGDYDADGVTSSVLMMHTLSYITDNYCHYIPSRFGEGYGLNKNAIKKIRDEGADLLITVDCGCTSHDDVEFAKEIGLTVIVTDHHNIDGRLPDCLVINPKQEDCAYPYDMLCGCGVAFKLTQAIQRTAGLPRKLLNETLDLAAIATVGDIVPLRDENRTIVKTGMRMIAKNRRPGLAALLKAAGMKPGELTSYDIAFGIVPRINAAGRLSSAGKAVSLLSDDGSGDIYELAAELNHLNDERKRIQNDIYDRLCEETRELGEIPDFLIYDAGDAHEGVCGIVAGKLKETYYRPVVILTHGEEDGIMKGTGRSIPGIDLFGMIEKYGELFTKFGGHAAACGFSLKSENYEKLKNGLTADAKSMRGKDPDLFIEKIRFDADITVGEITKDLIDQIELLEPFGEGNERPVFRLSGVTPVSPKEMSGGLHMRYQAEDEYGNRIQCVHFRLGEEAKKAVSEGAVCTLYGSPELNTYYGRTNLQFKVSSLVTERDLM